MTFKSARVSLGSIQTVTKPTAWAHFQRGHEEKVEPWTLFTASGLPFWILLSLSQFSGKPDEGEFMP